MVFTATDVIFAVYLMLLVLAAMFMFVMLLHYLNRDDTTPWRWDDED